MTFILKQHTLNKKNIPVQWRGFAHSCHAKQCKPQMHRGLGCAWVSSASAESLYVGLASRTEIVVVASWWQFDIGTVSYFQFKHPELQQLILIPGILNLSLKPRLRLLRHKHLHTHTSLLWWFGKVCKAFWTRNKECLVELRTIPNHLIIALNRQKINFPFFLQIMTNSYYGFQTFLGSTLVQSIDNCKMMWADIECMSKKNVYGLMQSTFSCSSWLVLSKYCFSSTHFESCHNNQTQHQHEMTLAGRREEGKHPQRHQMYFQMTHASEP